MAKHLNALLTHLAGLPAADAQLPTGVLLPLTRQHLARPILNLHHVLVQDRSVETLKRELGHLVPADQDMRQFRTDSVFVVAHGSDGRALVKVGQKMTSLKEGENGSLNQHRRVVELIYHVQDKASSDTPGRNVIYLFNYLWLLSWDKELWGTVEQMDTYLAQLPEIVIGHYDGVIS